VGSGRGVGVEDEVERGRREVAILLRALPDSEGREWQYGSQHNIKYFNGS